MNAALAALDQARGSTQPKKKEYQPLPPPKRTTKAGSTSEERSATDNGSGSGAMISLEQHRHELAMAAARHKTDLVQTAVANIVQTTAQIRTLAQSLNHDITTHAELCNILDNILLEGEKNATDDMEKREYRAMQKHMLFENNSTSEEYMQFHILSKFFKGIQQIGKQSTIVIGGKKFNLDSNEVAGLIDQS